MNWEWAEARGREKPAKVEVGVMLEAPALAWQTAALKGKADFLSIGTNDLMQYFFAADRGNPRVADRYDVLSPARVKLPQAHPRRRRPSRYSDLDCGEAAGRPLEAHDVRRAWLHALVDGLRPALGR